MKIMRLLQKALKYPIILFFLGLQLLTCGYFLVTQGTILDFNVYDTYFIVALSHLLLIPLFFSLLFIVFLVITNRKS